jgi:hypothetical protein
LELKSYNVPLSTIKLSGMDLGIAIGKQEDNTMPGLRAMFLDMGPNGNIRCRFICDCCKVESYVYSNARLFSEIEKAHPDVVVCMSSKGFRQIGPKNKRGFQVPNTLSRMFKQPLMSNYTFYADALYFS